MLAVIAAEALLLPWPLWVWLPALVVSAVVGGTNIHFAEMHRKDANLRVAQQAVEEMARIAERERIGRDLHDLLGHTLSVIVLKSELASSSPIAIRRAPSRRSATSSASRARRSPKCARPCAATDPRDCSTKSPTPSACSSPPASRQRLR